MGFYQTASVLLPFAGSDDAPSQIHAVAQDACRIDKAIAPPGQPRIQPAPQNATTPTLPIIDNPWPVDPAMTASSLAHPFRNPASGPGSTAGTAEPNAGDAVDCWLFQSEAAWAAS